MNHHHLNGTKDTPTDGSSPIRERICAALARILGDGVDVHRCLAAQALGQMGGDGAVAALLEALLDEDPDVRTDAATALARLADPRAETALLANLEGDPCNDVKLAAIDGLVAMGSAAVVPVLRRLVRGRDEEIFVDDGEFFEGGWDDWVDIQAKSIEGLAALGVVEAADDIVAAVDDEFGQDLSEAAFKALGRLGAPGVTALAGYVKEADERRRRRAVTALAAVEGTAAAAAVARALADPAPAVRLAAAEALATRDATDPRLAALFDDADAGVRGAIVRLCGAAHAGRLAALLADAAPGVRAAALAVVAGHPRSLTPETAAAAIGPLFADADAAVAERAVAAYAASAAPDADHALRQLAADVGRPEGVRAAAVRGLAESKGDAAARVLADLVADDLRQVRLEAMAGLATLAATADGWPNLAGESLLAALRGDLVAPPEAADGPAPGRDGDDGGEQPLATAECAPAADDGEADDGFPVSTLDAILDGDRQGGVTPAGDDVELDDVDVEYLSLAGRGQGKKVVSLSSTVAPHDDVRRFAARVLGDVGRAAAAAALADCLTDGDAEVRIAAVDSLARLAESLGRLPAPARDALVAAASAADRDMRLAAVRGLGVVDEAPVALLRRALADDDSFVRVAAVEALGRRAVDADTLDAVAGRLADGDASVRRAAAAAVARAGGDTALERLFAFAFAFGGEHRRHAGRLLRRLDGAAASARFLDVLADERRRRQWQVAIEALEEINRIQPSDRAAVVAADAADEDEERHHEV